MCTNLPMNKIRTPLSAVKDNGGSAIYICLLTETAHSLSSKMGLYHLLYTSSNVPLVAVCSKVRLAVAEPTSPFREGGSVILAGWL